MTLNNLDNNKYYTHAGKNYTVILNYEIPSVRWNRIITRAVKKSKDITFVIISYRENTRTL